MGDQDPTQSVSYNRLTLAKAEVDEVVDIMAANVGKVLEREGRLSELEDRSNTLQDSTYAFVNNSTRLKRRFWWKNVKMNLILVGVIIVLFILAILLATSSSDSNVPSPPVPEVTKAPEAKNL